MLLTRLIFAELAGAVLSAYGADICQQGFVWREAFFGDHVCVTAQARSQAAAENADPAHVEPCRPGLVWREARQADHTCVPVARRSAVAEENRFGPTHAGGAPQAGCSGFRIDGKWDAIQSNGFRVQFNLQQTGSRLHGTASFPEHFDSELLLRSYDLTLGGVADGVINDRTFAVSVYWDHGSAGLKDGGSIGIYQGTVAADGHINGSTHDKVSPANVATWYSKQGFNCR